MKKIVNIFVGIILLASQTLIYHPAIAQTGASSSGSSGGGSGTVSGFFITSITKLPAKDLMKTNGFQINWQRTTQIESDAASGLLQSFSLYRSSYGTREMEVLVQPDINKMFYYTIDEGVPLDVQPTYRIVAKYTNGQILSTPAYTYGLSDVEDTPNIVGEQPATSNPTSNNIMGVSGGGTTGASNTNPYNSTYNPANNSSAVGGTGQTLIDPATTPMCSNTGCNLVAVAEASKQSGSSFDIGNFVKDLFSNFVSLGSNTNYNSELPTFSEIPSAFQNLGFEFPEGFGDADRLAIIEEATKTATDRLGRRPVLGELTEEVLRSNPDIMVEDSAIPTSQKRFIDDNRQRYIENQKDWIEQGGAAGGPSGGGGNTSEDASESAGYFTKVLDQINPINIESYQCQSNTGIFCVLENLIKVGLALAGLIAVAFIVYGGFLYITSAGNPEGSKAGLAAVTNASIGLVIVLAAWVIINTVLTVLNKGSL